MPTRRPLVFAAALLALLTGVAGSTALAASDGRPAKVSGSSGNGVALHVPQSVRSSLQLRGARLLSPKRRGSIRLQSHDPVLGETFVEPVGLVGVLVVLEEMVVLVGEHALDQMGPGRRMGAGIAL